MNPEIPLSEKIYLLSVHPTKGGIRADSLTALKFVLTGSLLLELYMSKKIRFEGKHIVVADSESDNELHQFLLDKLGAVKKPLKVARWMNKLQFSSQYIKEKVRQNLEEKRIIRTQKKRFLFFRWKQSVLVNKPVVSKVISETDRAIYRSQVSEEEMVLLSMLRPAGALKRIYPDREKRRKAIKRLKQHMAENQVSGAVSNAIDAAKAVAASISATTTVTSH